MLDRTERRETKGVRRKKGEGRANTRCVEGPKKFQLANILRRRRGGYILCESPSVLAAAPHPVAAGTTSAAERALLPASPRTERLRRPSPGSAVSSVIAPPHLFLFVGPLSLCTRTSCPLILILPFPSRRASVPPQIVDGEGRGRGRGRGRGDRGRGGRGRAFDRHSATGKTCVFSCLALTLWSDLSFS